jgi:hypothetical protein
MIAIVDFLPEQRRLLIWSSHSVVADGRSSVRGRREVVRGCEADVVRGVNRVYNS